MKQCNINRIGILTFHNAKNYGAILQCFSLQEFIKESFGIDPIIINYTPQQFRCFFYDPLKPLKIKNIKLKIKVLIKDVVYRKEMVYLSRKFNELNRFINQYLNLSNEIKSLAEVNNLDLIISGSDQIWNLELLNNDTTYLLKDWNLKKISYGASFKVADVDDFAFKTYENCLKKFDAISVREENLRLYLKENFALEASVVLDPTLLIDKSIRSSFNLSCLVNKRYVVLYYVNLPKKMIDYVFKFAKDNDCVVVSLNHLRKEKRKYIDYSNASVEEFLSLIKFSFSVFTTSFHGMAYSIIFKRDFYFEVPSGSYNNNERLTNLANKLGLENRNIDCNSDIKINRDDVDKRLEAEKNKSYAFLNKSIFGGQNEH